MIVESLVQIKADADQKAKEEEKRREIIEKRKKEILEINRMDMQDLLKSHPVMTIDHDSYKLRTSKWFNHGEMTIVCSVFESGFITEKRHMMRDDLINTYGIVLWDKGCEKSKDPKHLKIYTLVDEKIEVLKLEEFWTSRTQIKISNSGDRFYPVNDEVTIRYQIKRAEKMKFEKDEHFVCFCRYKRPRKLSDTCWRLSHFFSRIRALSANW